MGVVLILVGALAPWIVSGDTTRNSFSTVTTARRLGVVGDGPPEALLVAWYAVPTLVVVVLVLLWRGARRAAAGLAAAIAVAAVAFAVAVGRAPVDTAVGPAITIAAGLGTLVASVVSLAGPGRRPPTTAPTSPARPGQAPRSS